MRSAEQISSRWAQFWVQRSSFLATSRAIWIQPFLECWFSSFTLRKDLSITTWIVSEKCFWSVQSSKYFTHLKKNLSWVPKSGEICRNDERALLAGLERMFEEMMMRHSLIVKWRRFLYSKFPLSFFCIVTMMECEPKKNILERIRNKSLIYSIFR